jgi:hypothetical protein
MNRLAVVPPGGGTSPLVVAVSYEGTCELVVSNEGKGGTFRAVFVFNYASRYPDD